MRIKVASNVEDLELYKHQWQELVSGIEGRTLPLTYEWLSAWWKNFGESGSLSVFFFVENETLIGVAPVYKYSCWRCGLRVRVLELMANGHSPFSGFIIAPSIGLSRIGEMLEGMMAQTSVDVWVLKKIIKRGLLAQAAESIVNDRGLRSGQNSSIVTPFVPIVDDWESFFSQRSKKFKRNLKNKLNKFNRASGMAIRRNVVTGVDHPAVQGMIEISKKSWKATIKNDLGSNVAGRNFLFDLIRAFGPQGNVHIWLMSKENTPIAFELHIAHNRTVYPLRADFDDIYRKESAGSVLEYTALKSLFDDQLVDEYYSCGDNYQYLRNWTNEIEEHFDIEIFSGTHKAKALYFLEYKVKPALRPCYRMYKRIKQRLSWS